MTRRSFEMTATVDHEVQHFSKEDREVVMIGIDDNSPLRAARLPKRRRRCPLHRNLAMLNREGQSQTFESHAPVLQLLATFAGLGLDPGRSVHQVDGALRHIAVLSAWTTTPPRARLAVSQQQFVR